MLAPITSPRKFQKLLLVAIGVFAGTLTGCGDSNRAKIVGTWGIERADTVLRKIESKSDGQGAQQSPESESATPKMMLKFERDGMLVTTTKIGAVDQTKQGTWKFDSYDEASNEMQLSCSLMDQDSEHSVEFVDKDTIKLVPPNMAGTRMKLKFKRIE